MSKDKNSFIHYTKQVWQAYYQEELTDNDATEIIDNMTGFINLLIKWNKADQKK